MKECVIGWSAWFLWNPKLLVRSFFIIGFISPTVLSPICYDNNNVTVTSHHLCKRTAEWPAGSLMVTSIQWLKKLSQCLALFDCLWHSITSWPNKAKVSVYEREYYMMATCQIKNYVIWCCIHGDIANSVWWLIGTVIWVGIRNAENTEFSTLYCLPWP